MPRIIKKDQIVEDTWVQVGASEPFPEGDILVSLERWQAEQETLQAHAGRVGLCLIGKDNPRELKGLLDQFALIAVEFPKFADGRGYSIARILRDELGYKGELRATGDILRDQLFYLMRCGFDAFAVREDRDIEDALAGLRDFSVVYQAASDYTSPIYRRFGRTGA
ncbi:MAG: DUF934 domain-containing protein [Myxococcales bacterium]|nr:DUF934 domain-containing protein [Myxococcales bacterium]MCB9642316.1 DUF934 domain-containing protein [Myxococcales bacterium]